MLPATTTLERDDIGAADRDPLMIAMKRLIDPVGAARDDYDIFAGIAQQLGKSDAFTEGRSSREWLAFLYETTRSALEAQGHDAPDFETFWQRGELVLPTKADDGGPAHAFRADPEPRRCRHHRERSRSSQVRSRASVTTTARAIRAGSRREAKRTVKRISIHFHLVCNQPRQRLHSQLDYGDYSRSTKIKGGSPFVFTRRTPADAVFRRAILSGSSMQEAVALQARS